MTTDAAAPGPRPLATDTLPLILLIPGLDGTGRFFDWQIKALSARYRPLAWRFRPRTRFDFPDLVEELEEATANEPPGSVTVAGESFGGTVALHFALSCPGRLRLLGLINTFCYYRHRIRIHLGCRLAPLLRWKGLRGLKNFVADRTLALEGIPLEGRQLYHDVVEQIHQAAYWQRLELVRKVDLRNRLSEIAVPTRIFAAGRDKIVPSIPSARFMASRIPNARIYEFPAAGHALLLTPGFSLADYL